VALGESRKDPPAQSQRRPNRKTNRRWIAAARPNSISCSQIAQASASNGSGLPDARRPGVARTERPIIGSNLKRS
jgi:hypothetical protein